MARTPLLSRIQQLFQDFDEAERSGRAVAARSSVLLMWNSRRRATASPA